MVQMWKHRDALVNVNAIEIVGNNLKQKRHSLPESEAANCSSDAVESSQQQHALASLLPARNECLHGLYILRRDVMATILLHHVIEHHLRGLFVTPFRVIRTENTPSGLSEK
jgi:hypothetical protein